MEKSLRLYNMLVNRVPGIELRYQKYRNNVSGGGRILAWGYLFILNFRYYVLRQKSINEPAFMRPDKNKKLPEKGSESENALRISPAEFAKKLSKYDIVSFDVFDTLIFRAFDRPSALFYMVGGSLGYPNFSNIRRQTERKAREIKYAAEGTREVSFEEIWRLMEEETGIPADLGMQAEWEAEKQYSFANPYYLETVKELGQYGSRIIFTSDMYFDSAHVEELLESCGYPVFDGGFVSCEYKKNKNTGSLFDYIKEVYGQELSYVHTGDNRISDQERAKEHGFKVFEYINVNKEGSLCRSADMSEITGSMYRGIVNAHLKNGLAAYTKAYEFGFVYGGLFVFGYCRFIHEYVKDHNIEKILFLSRDGDILNKAYRFLYPEEAGRCEYVFWSRLAAAKLTADHFRHDYFRRFLYHKINQGYHLWEIFAAMELSDMLDGFLESSKGKYSADFVLTEAAADDIKRYLSSDWAAAAAHYEGQRQAGGKYYEEVLRGVKNAAAVDIGWAGSGAITLDYMVNEVWNLDCRITGLLAGTNSAYTPETDSSETFLYSGKLVSYLFSQADNRNIWKVHNPGQNHNVIMELLLCSNQATVKGFGPDGAVFGRRADVIDADEVQRGIMDFVRIFSGHFGRECAVGPADAFAPINLLYNNQGWLKDVIKQKNVVVNLE